MENSALDRAGGSSSSVFVASPSREKLIAMQSDIPAIFGGFQQPLESQKNEHSDGGGLLGITVVPPAGGPPGGYRGGDRVQKDDSVQKLAGLPGPGTPIVCGDWSGVSPPLRQRQHPTPPSRDDDDHDHDHDDDDDDLGRNQSQTRADETCDIADDGALNAHPVSGRSSPRPPSSAGQSLNISPASSTHSVSRSSPRRQLSPTLPHPISQLEDVSSCVTSIPRVSSCPSNGSAASGVWSNKKKGSNSSSKKKVSPDAPLTNLFAERSRRRRVRNFSLASFAYHQLFLTLPCSPPLLLLKGSGCCANPS